MGSGEVEHALNALVRAAQAGNRRQAIDGPLRGGQHGAAIGRRVEYAAEIFHRGKEGRLTQMRQGAVREQSRRQRSARSTFGFDENERQQSMRFESVKRVRRDR